MSEVVVGLDIGTSSVRAVIGEIAEDEKLQITGVGKAASTGLRNGVIVNIESTMRSITEAVEAAEMMSGKEVASVVTGIGGSSVESLNSTGIVAVSSHGTSIREIKEEDVSRVIDAAKAVPVPLDRQILHVVPRSYTIDGQQGIKQPIDMIGTRLEADVHIVTAAVTSMQNIIRCVGRAGYEVDGVMLKTLASSQAVMTDEEKDLGSIVIDLGGGSTDALVIADGAPFCTASVPIGGNAVTNDISIVCGISFDVAERIKLSSGCAWEPLLDTHEEVIIPGVGGRPPETISRNEICRIIYPRLVETLSDLREKIGASVKDKHLLGNIILVGGGAMMPGMVDVVSEVFDTSSVRIGTPGNFGGLLDEYSKPEYAAAVGLVVSNLDKRRSIEVRGGDASQPKGKNIFSAVTGWFKEFF